MARGKKAAKELTVEEKLEQALVPVDEQPYPVPENWCWTLVGNICDFIGGGTPDKTIPEYWNGNIPWASVKDIKGDYLISTKDTITSIGLEKSAANLCEVNDLIMITRIEPAKTIISNIVTAINQDLKVVKSPLPSIFLHYYFENFKHVFEAKASGSTVKGITISNIKNVFFPLPPIAEQQRIVDRIESIFAKLDEAKEKAEAVVDGFELRKSAILHKAFTGELTEKWRQEYGKSNSDWRIVRFDEVAEIKSNIVEPADFQTFPHIAPDNIEKKTGVLLEYHTIAEDGVKSGKHRFYAGQILYSKIRPYLSKVVVVDFDGLCSADMYPIDAKEDTRYLWYYMLSDEFLDQTSNAGSRSVLPKINQKELAKITVRMTSVEEQQVIVEILDSFFEKERQAKESVELVLDLVDTMKKTVLSRAFRGELGTNDPTEENAMNLLKYIFNKC